MNNDTVNTRTQVTYTTSNISADHNQYDNIPHDYQQPVPNTASNDNVAGHNQQQQYDTLNINQQSTSENILPSQFYSQHTNQNIPRHCVIFHNNSQQTVIFNNSTNNSILMQPHTCLNCSSINNSQTRSQ
jgi:hypothetical protein